MKPTDQHVQLDAVLSFFKNNEEANAHVDVQHIYALFIKENPGYDLSESAFSGIIQRLIQDHFIMKFPLDAAYYITNDGRAHKGYQHAYVWYRRQPFKNITYLIIFSSTACVFVIGLSWAIRHLFHYKLH